MERFLDRHQVLKPDPGIVARKEKAQAHRRIEKLIDRTLHKRKKLEIRTQATSQGAGDIAVSRPPNKVEWRKTNIGGFGVMPHSVLEETMHGETGFALHHAFVPARAASAPGVVPIVAARKQTQHEGTTFHTIVPAKGNNKKYEHVQAGQHVKDREAQRTLESGAHVHPGLMAHRMLGMK